MIKRTLLCILALFFTINFAIAAEKGNGRAFYAHDDAPLVYSRLKPHKNTVSSERAKVRHARMESKKKSIPASKSLAKKMQAETPKAESHTSSGFFSGLFVSSVKGKVVAFVHKTVDSINYNKYKLGGRQFDPAKGVFVLDCSDYVDNILQNVHPDAYTSLMTTTGSGKPTSLNYYNFFTRLSDENDYWNKVNDVERLEPGDILVFKNKTRRRSGAAGHVMIVMKKPVQTGSAYMVRVADSAPFAHSNDTRKPRKSGIGIGTLLLRVDPNTGQPTAYAWRIGSRWKNNVHFAMGRPVNLS